MSELSKATFLRVLKGAPLSVLIGLWVHGPMGRTQLKRKTGWDLKTLDDALAFLDDLELVTRPHYRKWALADGFKQLPLANLGLPESGNSPSSAQRPLLAESGNSPSSTYVNDSEDGNSPSSDFANNSESGNSPSSANANGAESGNSPSSAPPSDRSDRSDDEEEDEVDRFLPAHFSMSKHLLESIGIGGKELYQMAQYKPFEILAAWWYLLGSG
ncbi:MAG: hypothetical protein GY943_25210, partial [Chloroflexi bacterium]|nr:hypothetical protein [Chloroflexota bacterium]